MIVNVQLSHVFSFAGYHSALTDNPGMCSYDFTILSLTPVNFLTCDSVYVKLTYN